MNIVKQTAVCGRLWFVAWVALTLGYANQSAWSATDPLAPKDVMCGAVKCGTLEVDKYQASANNATMPVEGFLAIDIIGLFKPTVNKVFHFIQGITSYNSTDRRWINDTSVPIGVPFLDTPPDGYKVKATWDAATWTAEQKFDGKPYYDEPADVPPFPAFYDSPGMYMLPAKNGNLSWSFETWVVCVISEMFGPNADTAKDDNYKVAPLLGFHWGFDIIYKDVGVIGTDELADFSVQLKDLDWDLAPSAAWTSALGAKYGAGALEDFFNVAIGPCENCVPEPGTLPVMAAGLLLVGLVLRGPRRRSQGRWAAISRRVVVASVAVAYRLRSSIPLLPRPELGLRL